MQHANQPALADIMNRNVAYVQPACTLADAAKMMAGARISSLLVMNGAKPVGIVTERDLVRHLHGHVAPGTPISGLMSSPVLTAPAGLDFGSAYALTLERHVRHLVVLDDGGAVAGIVSETDFRAHLGLGLLRKLDNLSEVMDREMPLLTPEASLDEALALMLQNGTTYVLVVRERAPLGILTERDIPALFESGVAGTTPLADLVHAPLRSVPLSTSVAQAAGLMFDNHIRHLAVVDDAGKIAGMLTQHRLLERVGLKMVEETWHQQKLSREEKAALETRLQMVLEATGVGIWEYDVKADALRPDETLCRMVELDGASLPLRLTDWQERVHPDDRAEFLGKIQAALGAESPFYEAEYRFRLANGGWLWLHAQGRAVRHGDGLPLFFVGTASDVTQRKQAEYQLRLLNETLEQRVQEELAKNRAKDLMLIEQSRLASIGDVVRNVAHHWRQPLNAVSLVLGNIKDAYEYHELSKDYLDQAVHEGQILIQRMSSTIDAFRNFFASDAGKSCFQVGDKVGEAIRLANQGLKYRNIEIDLSVADESCQTVGYPNEFAQVVLNILNNAEDAIVGGKTAGKIHVQVGSADQRITVAIRDNGGGIPEDILGKVFDPYFTTKGTSGAGIGLYMSKMIMDNMGGSISIRNLDGGAETLLTLPLALEAAI